MPPRRGRPDRDGDVDVGAGEEASDDEGPPGGEGVAAVERSAAPEGDATSTRRPSVVRSVGETVGWSVEGPRMEGGLIAGQR